MALVSLQVSSKVSSRLVSTRKKTASAPRTGVAIFRFSRSRTVSSLLIVLPGLFFLKCTVGPNSSVKPANISGGRSSALLRTLVAGMGGTVPGDFLVVDVRF